MTMRKTLLSLFAALAAFTAAGQPVERIYVSTDKGAYVAGDLVWCSLFCIDAAGTPVLSSASSIAYLELVSSQGTAVTGKIALIGGRGAGVLALPANMPTGNYALVAYTSCNRNEQGRGYLDGARILSVFNTMTTERIPGGVEIIDNQITDTEYALSDPLGGLALQVNRRAKAGSVLPLFLRCGTDASVSVSVYRTDEIAEPAAPGIDRFLAGLPAPGSVRVTGNRIPDFDGEVIYATINGKDREKALSVPHPVAIISAQGAASDTYTSDFQDGKAVFFTNNIYGDRDLVCELGGMDEGTQCFLHLEQPYLYPTVGGIPPLKLSEAYRTALLERHLAMQAFHAGYADTLVQFLPVRENLLLRREDRTVYHLDDYVRFPTVDEVLVELVPELRVRKGKRRTREIQMLYTDKAGALSYFRDNILVLLDGIAVTDHARLLEYDALLFQDIEIYPHPYLFGMNVYNGIVNFSTRKGGSLSLRMNDLTQVIDFKGASYPVALTGKHVPAENDRRQTLFWHPAVTLPAGQEVRLEVRTGALPGRYRVVVEGLDGRLGAVRSEAEFEVY